MAFRFLLPLAVLWIAVLGSPAISAAQTPGPIYDLDKDRQLLVSLDGPWHRQLGDNPSWADPAFDDSKWPIVRPTQPWSEQKFSGSAWYRATIRVPANAGPLSLYVSRIFTSYQIFANGQLVASFGGLPPHPYPYAHPSHSVSLPVPPTGQPYTLLLAIRVWHWPIWAEYEPGGLYRGLRIGSPPLIQKTLDTRVIYAGWRSVSAILLAILEGLAALTALALFAFRRQQREFLWFALLLLASVVNRCFETYTNFHPFGADERDLVLNLIQLVSLSAQIAFYYRLLGGKRNWLFWGAIGSVAGQILIILPEYQDRFDVPTLNVVLALLSIPFNLWILALLLRRAQQGFQDARLLLAPVFLSKTAGLIGLVYWIAFTVNWNIGSSDWINETFSWPFNFSLADLADALFLVGMLAILIRRFTRTQRHEETYEREREAARTVQQVLIPEEIPPIPGFSIACVYRPFGEVGGDFFQVIPLESDSVLIAIGDVSGKGLPAALMVSLLVGTLRTYAETLSSPAQILAGLNRRVHGRTGGGFTTCLILRADPDGTLTLANAGHLSPYTAGQEIPLQSGLPLGILPEATYEEATHSLHPGESITLLTDGVLEARNSTGELFGFDRTQSISHQSPAEIAHAAQSHGQDDDITVLQLTCQSQ